MASEEKFLRTPTQARGRITEEERAKIEEISKKWMAIGLRTDPIDPKMIIPAIKGLYRVANLQEPRVIIVSSPIVAVSAGSISVGINQIKKDAKEGEFSRQVIDAALYKAVDVVRDSMGLGKTVVGNILKVVEEVTNRETPPRRKIAEITTSEQPDVQRITTFLLNCIQRWWHMYQGGNLWPGASSYLESMRDVIGLTGLPGWDTYQWWEDCAKHGSLRVIHKDFCLVSDFPCKIQVDEQFRQHCEDGPSHEWRDGWKLYHFNGIMVAPKVIEAPTTITVEEVREEQNAEVRRIMITRMGWDKFVEQAKVSVIHEDQMEAQFPAVPVSELVTPEQRFVYDYRSGVEKAELLKCEELTDFDQRPLIFVRLTDPSTGRQYTMRTRHDVTRCYEAVGLSFDMTEEQYKKNFYIRQGDVQIRSIGGTREGLSLHS